MARPAAPSAVPRARRRRVLGHLRERRAAAGRRGLPTQGDPKSDKLPPVFWNQMSLAPDAAAGAAEAQASETASRRMWMWCVGLMLTRPVRPGCGVWE